MMRGDRAQVSVHRERTGSRDRKRSSHMTIALLAPLLLAAGTADVSTLDSPAIVAKDDYTDDTDLCLTAPIAKPYYEEGMACIGKYQGTRAMQVRITDFITDEQKKKEWTDQ